MGDFTIHSVTRSRAFLCVMMVVTFSAGVALILLGTRVPDEDSHSFYYHGILGFGATFYCIVLYFSLGYIIYEDEGDHLRIRFGPCCLNNIFMDCCCCCTCLNGKIRYEDIDRVDYTNSTCLDGCGIRLSKAGDAVYTTSCCVPAVEVYSNNTGCCFSGRYVLGVESQDQAEELMLKISDKISTNAVSVV